MKIKRQHPHPTNPYYNYVETTCYPFNEESIDDNVPKEIVCGNYRIGQIIDGIFQVAYAGRVDTRSLNTRLKEHLNEFEEKDDLYFDYEKASSPTEAYQQECRDYHQFQDVLDSAYFRNKIHPDKPNGFKNTNCPECGA